MAAAEAVAVLLAPVPARAQDDADAAEPVAGINPVVERAVLALEVDGLDEERDAARALAALDRGSARKQVSQALAHDVDAVLPALILAEHDGAPGMRHWATGRLDGLGKKVPGDCVQTKSIKALAAVLRSWGATQDADALPVVLSFANSDRQPVRDAARRAIGAYGEQARPRLREIYASLLGTSAPPDWSAAQIAGELFAAYDRIRLEDVNAMVEAGLDKYRAGDLAGAVADFDRVLARQPDLERRIEMVAAYVLYAQSIEDTDRERAGACLRKALALAPEGPRVAQIQSQLAYLEGMDRLGRGIEDPEPFRRAIALDAANTRAQAGLDRIASAREARQKRTRRWLEALGAAAALLLGLALFWRRSG